MSALEFAFVKVLVIRFGLANLNTETRRTQRFVCSNGFAIRIIIGKDYKSLINSTLDCKSNETE